jgi:hypothetical protein
MHDQSIGHETKTPRKAAVLPNQTDVTDFAIPGYSICSALAEHISALTAIELAAAQLLRGYAPESVLAETTDERTFADAARDGCLWVASNMPVGFALVDARRRPAPSRRD